VFALEIHSLILIQRRRQNRESQRRYRERRENHVKELEDEIQSLKQRCAELQHNFEQQRRDNVVLLAELANTSTKVALTY
jgi:TolA-binding protein